MEHPLNKILNKIRPNRSSLYTFFAMMPKGGDLHHHYSGAVYAETYIDYVIAHDYYVNIDTYDVTESFAVPPSPLVMARWKKFSELPNLDNVKLQLLRKWSDKDFVRGAQSPDEHFFNTFIGFGDASKQDYLDGLQQLKTRALSQKLNYIETIFASLPLSKFKVNDSVTIDQKMEDLQKAKDQAGLYLLLESIYQDQLAAISAIAQTHTGNVTSYHTESNVEDDEFTLRFQNYAARFKKPTDMFVDLMGCFISCASSDLIVGVNIVAAENGAVAMRDYWLHMHFYGFLETKYSNVTYSIHAGELVSGMVAPEFLGTHIRDALFLKNLKRIGHGVDIIYDNEFIKTIATLKEKQTVIEINLSSNEFILGVSDDIHPIELYYRNQVPIVICTDDEGVLRTSITEQYVLTAHRYKLDYEQIKEIVKNSIRYSLLKEATVKEKLLKQLDEEFDEFEKAVVNFYLPLVTEQKEGEEPKLKMMSLSL